MRVNVRRALVSVVVFQITVIVLMSYVVTKTGDDLEWRTGVGLLVWSFLFTPVDLVLNTFYNHWVFVDSTALDDALTRWSNASEIVIAVAACGRLSEVLTMIKSALVFSHSPIMFHVFTEPQFVNKMLPPLSLMRQMTQGRMQYVVHAITYPETESYHEWKRLVINCASQRLFFPDILPDVDALLFLDSDILFMGKVEDVWAEFQAMNDTQELAAAPNHYGIYRDLAPALHSHPYYGDFGVNAGVMLMNLTRLRASNFTKEIVQFYSVYKLYLISGDQDLINIYMHFYAHRVMITSYRLNYRPEMCTGQYEDLTRDAVEKGVLILHGTALSFVILNPVFMAIHESWRKYNFGTDPYLNIYKRIKYELSQISSIECNNLTRFVTKGFAHLKPLLSEPRHHDFDVAYREYNKYYIL